MSNAMDQKLHAAKRRQAVAATDARMARHFLSCGELDLAQYNQRRAAFSSKMARQLLFDLLGVAPCAAEPENPAYLLHDLRIMEGMNQTEAALLLGYAKYSPISRMENGTVAVDGRTRRLLRLWQTQGLEALKKVQV